MNPQDLIARPQDIQNTVNQAANIGQAAGGIFDALGTAAKVGTDIASRVGPHLQGSDQQQDRRDEIQDYIDNLDSRFSESRLPVLAPDFDTSGNIKRARRKAAKAQNPVYERMLNQHIEEFNRQREQARTGAEQSREELQTGFQQTQEDIATQREREQEDFQTDIENLTEEQRTTERVGGREFNRNRRDLQENVAAGNMATSGLGRQQVAEAEQDRALEVGETERQFQQKEQRRGRLKTRTLEDLMTKRERAEEETERGLEKVDVNLESELDRIRNQQQQRKFQTEQARLDAIRQDQNRIARQQTLNWINSISDPRQRQAARRAYL